MYHLSWFASLTIAGNSSPLCVPCPYLCYYTYTVRWASCVLCRVMMYHPILFIIESQLWMLSITKYVLNTLTELVSNLGRRFKSGMLLLCVCNVLMCVWLRMYMWVRVYIVSMLVVSREQFQSLLLSFEAESPTDLEFTRQAMLAVQWPCISHLSLFPQCWNCKHGPAICFIVFFIKNNAKTKDEFWGSN